MKLKKYITSMLVAGIVLTSTSSAFAMNNNSNNQDSIGVSKLSIQEIDDNKVNLKNSAPVEDKLKSIEEQEKEWKELEERVKAGDKDLMPTDQDLKEKGITTLDQYNKDADTYRNKIQTKVLTKKLKEEYAAAGLDENGHSINPVEVTAGAFDESMINDDVTLEDIYYTPNGNVEGQMDISDYDLPSEVLEDATEDVVDVCVNEVNTMYDAYKDAYKLAIEQGMDVILSQVTRYAITEYAKAHGLEIPK